MRSRLEKTRDKERVRGFAEGRQVMADMAEERSDDTAARVLARLAGEAWLRLAVLLRREKAWKEWGQALQDAEGCYRRGNSSVGVLGVQTERMKKNPVTITSVGTGSGRWTRLPGREVPPPGSGQWVGVPPLAVRGVLVSKRKR